MEGLAALAIGACVSAGVLSDSSKSVSGWRERQADNKLAVVVSDRLAEESIPRIE